MVALAPGVRATQNLEPVGDSRRDATFVNVVRGNVRYFADGEISYRDIFGDRCIIRYRYERSTETGEMEVCADGNSAHYGDDG